MGLDEILKIVKGDLADVIVSRGELFEEKQKLVNTFLLSLLRKNKILSLQSKYDKTVTALIKNLLHLIEEIEHNKKNG